MLSRNRRLGSPLTLRDATRLARFMSGSFHPSTLELHESILAALADLYIHGAALPPDYYTSGKIAGRDSSESSGKVSLYDDEASTSPSSTGTGTGCHAAEVWRRVWERHGTLPLDRVPTTLERVRCLETLGTVRDNREIDRRLCSQDGRGLFLSACFFLF